MIPRLLAGLIVGFALFTGSATAGESPDDATILVVRGIGATDDAPTAQAFSDAELAALPQHGYVVSTPWYPKPQHFEGPLLRDVLRQAGLPGRQLLLRALNDYAIAVPRDDVERYDVIVARKRNGKPMSVRDKGPLFVMYPFSSAPALRQTEYFRRCVWQLSEIEVR
ncbi:hypothetical protein [Chitiniphilus shinanonensis]|uniref:hypothetical protein n=1 Tax=Chitiniphilus shinanonensis TaxID=553088 RepID=UPI00303606F1